METVLITNIQFSSSQYGAAPQWLSVLVLRYLAIVVFLPAKKKNRVTVCLNQPARGTITLLLLSFNVINGAASHFFMQLIGTMFHKTNVN